MEKKTLMMSYIRSYYKVLAGQYEIKELNEKIVKVVETSKDITLDEFALKVHQEFPSAKMLHEALILKRLSSIDSTLKFFKVLSIISVIVTALAVLFSIVS